MVARLIYFGPDHCHRTMVLRNAGYCVEGCESVLKLDTLLGAGRAPDALLMSDGDGISPEEAIAIARKHCSNPAVLFRSTNLAYEESGFDLVIPCLTPPEVWLDDVDRLIARSRIR